MSARALASVFVCAILMLIAQAAKADCTSLVADADSMSAKASAVQSSESSGEDNAAKAAWNDMNHYALLGAHAFNSCDDTSSRLSYSVTFADATAVGMHYGLISWSEGTSDIGASLQIIDALPHSPTVEKEWDLVDRLYTQTCSMHGATCAKRTY
jgi:hypothetical protein